mmetsp:Transcript_60524/g.153491  ORF Transcript_60524/g.153491 Transcript_60524/m.153491 type:complete len:236 (-) Transcript_60524:140-847(-)
MPPLPPPPLPPPPFLPPLFQSPYLRSLRVLPSGIMQLFSVSMAASALSRFRKLIMPLPLAVPSSFSFTRTPPGAIAPNGEKILSKSWSVVSEGRPLTQTVLSSFAHVPPGRILCLSKPFHKSLMVEGSPDMPIIMPILPPIIMPPPLPAGTTPYGDDLLPAPPLLKPPPPKPPPAPEPFGGLNLTVTSVSRPKGTLPFKFSTSQVASSTDENSIMADFFPLPPFPLKSLHHLMVP